MKYEIVELEDFSGYGSKIYSIIPEGEPETLFDKFVEENVETYEKEVKEILVRIKQIGSVTGAREIFFKHEGDSGFVREYGKFVWALYDKKGSKLRLYCIRFSNIAVILGGGGYKDKSIKKWQDDSKLSKEARRIMAYARDILRQIDEGNIYWSECGTELEGKLKNYDDE